MTKTSQLIKARRQELSMTQEKLAELAGFGSFSIIANIEQGRLPPLKHIVTISNALGISHEQLLDVYMDDKKNQIASRIGLITR